MGSKSHFLKSFILCDLPRMARKSVKKFLMKMGAVFGLPRCIPSGSIAAKKVALSELVGSLLWMWWFQDLRNFNSRFPK